MRYYSLFQKNKEAHIYIFGDIVTPTRKDIWELESDASGFSLANEVKDLDVDVIHVHINSYGGAVSEGLAIYNTLKNHKAKVITYCDGFACSAASVVFMAGEERIMNDASLLMIHNAWLAGASGNAKELRKQADDLEIINQAAVEAYKSHAAISEADIKKLMDEETWISPTNANKWGFATAIETNKQASRAAASAKNALFLTLTSNPEPTIDVDELADKIVARLKDNPVENKTINFLSAILGERE